MTTLRSSELDRSLACPGSIISCGLVAPRQGDEGDEGTSLHHDSALRIITELGGCSQEPLPKPDPNWPTLRFSKWIADYYVRHVQENTPQGWALEVECPLAYEFDFLTPRLITVVEWIDGRPFLRQRLEKGFILSGHIDAVAISPDATKAIGWDLKTGFNPVDDAEQNWQMLGYIVLLKRAYPTLREVTFYIVQPRNDEDEGFQRVSRVTLDALENIVDGFVHTIGNALERGDELNSGRQQCAYCDAALQCEALKADRDLMRAKLTQSAVEKIKMQPDDKTLADWVIAGRTLARPIEDAQELAKERIATQGGIMASDGTQITVKITGGSYTVTDKAGLFAAVQDMLPPERLPEVVKVSITALREQVATHTGLPLSSKVGQSATSVVENRTAGFLQKGERRIFQYR